MKNIKIVGLLLASLMVSPVYAAEMKIGVVNASVVLDQSPQKERALARLEKEFSTRSKSLENKLREVRAAQDKLNRDAAVLGNDERQAQERKIINDQRELKRLQDEYSEDLSIRRNEELRKLEEEIAETIVELAKKESYDLVLYQGVIFASERADLTAKVLERLKAK
ncbi:MULTISPECIES: OmpH family outer membrane protein [Methylophaga]|uniref:Chaperone protein Skp n=1 Tax=Methylophaga muralis TaxID=291169 RepID=A0A1E3GQM8_9GAMM|nr:MULTISPECIES: OmpH family outer membrane protein [Methylophaga]ODN66324.1 Chaperone protein Skp precursor [Methylophaga muralis]THK43271.1 OmpH family outer membrane protein [Methylophaga sp. SB9B]